MASTKSPPKSKKARAAEPLSQLAIAWCLKNPNVSSVILGASTPEQLRENLGSVERVDLLTDETLEEIEGILGNRPKLPTQF